MYITCEYNYYILVKCFMCVCVCVYIYIYNNMWEYLLIGQKRIDPLWQINLLINQVY